MGANAQTTVPTFTAAQVLTADQMNQSARTGVPVFADTRTRIATNYFAHSDLQVQMYTGADVYITFGFVPFIVT